MSTRPSQITITPVDDGLVVEGEIDAHTAPRLERAVLDHIRRFGSTWLDARAVTFMDSSGLRVLVEATNVSRSLGGRLSLVSPPERIRRRIQLGGLGSHVHMTSARA